jgi:hypothetical protein
MCSQWKIYKVSRFGWLSQITIAGVIREPVKRLLVDLVRPRDGGSREVR